MEISPTLLILAGFIIILLGIGAGMLIASLSEEEEPQEEGGPQDPPGARKGRYKPVARLWRDEESGTLVVEMEGKSYISPAAMSDPQRGSLERAARDLRGWLGMGLEPAAPQTQEAAAPAISAPQQPVSVPQAAPTPAPYAAYNAGAAAPSQPAVPSRTAASSRPAVPYPVKGVTGPLTPVEDAGKQPPAVRSIVMQIEDILQDMIYGTEMARQGLHLNEDPLRGVIVTVDGKSYEGIEAVPEGEAKRAIRAAVAEWEKTQ